MATVTGFTATRMQAIEDATITSGLYDASGHLILTRHDGSQDDVGLMTAATTAQKGIVQLATNTEAQAGTDNQKVLTPAAVASLPGGKIITADSITESDTPAAWPYGVSQMSVSSGWSPGTTGLVITHSVDMGHTQQTFHGIGTYVSMWIRDYDNANSTWGPWQQVGTGDMTVSHIDTAKLAADLITTYPSGVSIMALTPTTMSSGSWTGLTGLYGGSASGIVHTERPHTGNGVQYFMLSGSSSTTPSMAMRVGDSSGWSSWRQVITDPGGWTSYTPTWGTSSGTALPSLGNATVACRAFKLGRKVDVQFAITFGSTTNFGTSPTTSDNWQFGLPPAWPAARSNDDVLGFADMYHDKYNFGTARVKLASTTKFGLGIASAFTGGSSGVASTNDNDIGGDVDSLSPFTWASGDILRGTFSYESAS